MIRKAFKMWVNPEAHADYERRHRPIWRELEQTLREHGVRTYSIFLDEGTSALDANNERRIMENLQMVFKGKTVVIVAHRLSTVKNADQIIVLDKGRIVEEGKHNTLIARKGHYFELVRNQLELGN